MTTERTFTPREEEEEPVDIRKNDLDILDLLENYMAEEDKPVTRPYGIGGRTSGCCIL